MKERFKNSLLGCIGALMLMICGFMPLTKTNLGIFGSYESEYEFGIAFVIAGIIGLALALLKAKKLLLIPAIVGILAALFMRTVLSIYGDLVSYTLWYYLTVVGSILLIIQGFTKPKEN